METSWEKQKEEAALTAKAKTTQLIDKHAAVVVVPVHKQAGLSAQAQLLDQVQQKVRSLKLVLDNREGDMLRARVDLSS